MAKIKTHSGDDGKTGVLGEKRLPKHHPRIETLGDLDEASSALGMARAVCQTSQARGVLLETQRDLYTIMTWIAAAPENTLRFPNLTSDRVIWLESACDSATADIPVPEEFILAGDSVPGAALDLARTVVRRAERRVADLQDRGEMDNPLILHYLNRLSTLCFALELVENQAAGHGTQLAKK